MPSEHIGRFMRRTLTRVGSVAAIGAALASAPGLAAQQLESWKTGPDKGVDRRFYPDDPIWRDADTRNIPPVAEFDLSKSYEFLNETFGESVQSRGPALNVNTLGEVPDSSWFTNRLGRHDMTIDEVVRGPNQVDGPAPGIWHVTGRPDSGITPKFTIKDARGDTYLIKLDPAKFPELPSSVEVISTKIASPSIGPRPAPSSGSTTRRCVCARRSRRRPTRRNGSRSITVRAPNGRPDQRSIWAIRGWRSRMPPGGQPMPPVFGTQSPRSKRSMRAIRIGRRRSP